MAEQSWQDSKGDCVSVDPTNGLVRIDGLPVFKVRTTKVGLCVQFKDSNKLRSKYRGTTLIEIPLEVFIERIVKGCT